MNPTTQAFQDLHRNLKYARSLIAGGRSLEALKVGTFDVNDLYRSAWVMAVAALDHWVYEEIHHRAVALVMRRAGAKPVKFKKLEIPIELFDQVHYGDASLEELFAQHLRSRLGYVSYQNPDRIREGFAHVSDVKLWPEVAKAMSAETGERLSQEQVKDRLRMIVQRRNKIAHEADRDPGNPGRRRPITADITDTTINELEAIAACIVIALAKG